MEVKTFPPREMKNISISYHTKLFPSFLLRMRILQRSQIKNFNRNPSKRQLHILLEQKKRRQKEIANNFLHCFWNVEQSLHCDGNHKKSKKQRAGKAKPQSSFSFVDKAIRWQTENGMQYSSSSSWSETDNSIKANNKRKLHCSFVETINRSVCVCARNWYCSFQKLFHVLRATIVRDRTRDRDEIESQLPSVFFCAVESSLYENGIANDKMQSSKWISNSRFKTKKWNTHENKPTHTVSARELHSMKNKHSLDLAMHGFLFRKVVAAYLLKLLHCCERDTS